MDRLIDLILKKNNPTVVGLDPKLDFIPSEMVKHFYDEDGCTLRAAGKALFEFNKQIIDAVYDIVPAVKPQLAYYEMFGYNGIKAFERTVKYAQLKGLYVIADGKRNDIGTTMEAYATAFLGQLKISEELETKVFGVDGLTVNAYLGFDGIFPLKDNCLKYDKDIFVLVKTSNKSSGELQDLVIANENQDTVNQETVSLTIGNLCETWGSDNIGKHGYSRVGAVIGATYPKQLEEFRKKLPHTFFLIPGYGAQGGGADDVKGAFVNGIGGIVNASRSIMCAYKAQNKPIEAFAECARIEAQNMKSALLGALG